MYAVLTSPRLSRNTREAGDRSCDTWIGSPEKKLKNNRLACGYCEDLYVPAHPQDVQNLKSLHGRSVDLIDWRN